MSDEKPFEGVHFYSAEELGVILAIFAKQFSKKTKQFTFGSPVFANNLATISAANAKTYERVHGIAKTPCSADEIRAALPPYPVPFPLGQLREFQKDLDFNLLGYEPVGSLRGEDIELLGPETNAAKSCIWFAVRDEHQGPIETE